MKRTYRIMIPLSGVERVGMEVLLASGGLLVNSRADLFRLMLAEGLEAKGFAELSEAILAGASVVPEVHREKYAALGAP